MTTVYSFSDVYMTISSPAYPAYVVNGQGVGEISISPINDNSAHDLAADGKVMVSKIKARNANVTITVQQTSAFHRWLSGLMNTLEGLPSNLWASISINLVTPNEIIYLTGVSFAKRADRTFQQQGQMYSWALMAADFQTDGSIADGLVSVKTSAAIIGTNS